MSLATPHLSPAQVLAAMIPTASKAVPDAQGRYGPYGGSYVPETLMVAVNQLADEYERARKDPEFWKQLNYYLKQFVGRPTPLYYAQRLTELAFHRIASCLRADRPKHDERGDPQGGN